MGKDVIIDDSIHVDIARRLTSIITRLQQKGAGNGFVSPSSVTTNIKVIIFTQRCIPLLTFFDEPYCYNIQILNMPKSTVLNETICVERIVNKYLEIHYDRMIAMLQCQDELIDNNLANWAKR